MGETDPAAARLRQHDTYEAQVFTAAATVELLKKSTTLEVAPVETSGAAHAPSRRHRGPRRKP